MKTSPFDLSSNDSSVSAGCLSGVIRRIVCGNQLHNASSRIVDTAEKTYTEKKPQSMPPPSPGLVARLMGLEPMPEIAYTSTPPDNSIRRSRSANSTESWNGFLSGHSSWATKSRNSHSFREAPTFLRAENKDFLLLSFSPDDNGEAFSSKKRSKKNASERRNNEIKENSIPPKKSSNCAPMKVDIECSSQNSSPVSVLDQPDLDSPISGENKESNQEKPRRKLSANVKSHSFQAEEIYSSKEANLRPVNVEKKRGTSSGRRQEALSDVWRQICQLAEEDHTKSNWVSMELMWGSGGKWEVAAVIEMEMMDSLLHETVAELSICKLPTL